MNKVIITIISIIVIVGAIIFGVAIYKPNSGEEAYNITTKVANENIEDDCTDEYQEFQQEMLQTSSSEEKISPNCYMTLKRTYKKCGHTTSEYLAVPEELVNKTQIELEKKYEGWTVEYFSDTQIVLNKNEEGECGEHYLVKDKEGKVTIYELLEDGTEKEYEITDIPTEYITDTDKINMKNGIKVNGKQELNQLIEDFE